MQKRRTRLIAAGCAACAIIAAAISAIPQPEPHYAGKSLSQWFTPPRGFQGDFPWHDAWPERTDAVRHIGTNVIPTALNWLTYEPNYFYNKLMVSSQRAFWLFKRPLIYEPYARSERAVEMFSMLGPAARPAIPEIRRIAMTSPQTHRQERCIKALYGIGPEARPTFLEIMTNTSFPRWARIFALSTFGARLEDSEAVFDALARCAIDPDDAVAFAARNALTGHRFSSNSVQILVGCLKSSDPLRQAHAAHCLATFHAAAKDAAPQLLVMLTAPSEPVRREAELALHSITNVPPTSPLTPRPGIFPHVAASPATISTSAVFHPSTPPAPAPAGSK